MAGRLAWRPRTRPGMATGAGAWCAAQDAVGVAGLAGDAPVGAVEQKTGGGMVEAQCAPFLAEHARLLPEQAPGNGEKEEGLAQEASQGVKPLIQSGVSTIRRRSALN